MAALPVSAISGRDRSAAAALTQQRTIIPISAIAIAVIGVGVTIRVVGYLSDWSLFIDDARLAINVGWRSFAALTRPLAFEQTGPLAFLWADRLITRFTGMNEYGLRIVPLIAGLLLLPAIWWVARRLFGTRAALVALLLAVASPLLLHYASYSDKPYGIDALVTILLVGATLRFIDGERVASRRRLVGLAAAGVLALCVSEPAVFVLGGVGLALIARYGFRRQVFATGTVWIAAFLALFFTVYRPAINSYLQWFWQGGFLRPGVSGWRWQAGRAFLETWSGVIDVPPTVDGKVLVIICGVVLFAGFIVVARRARWPAAVLVGAPYALLIVASLAARYPMGARVDLFVLPLLVLLTAALVIAIVDLFAVEWREPVFAAVIMGVCAWGAHSLGRWFGSWPAANEPTRELVRTVLHTPVSEPVYLYAAAVPAWIFYSTDWRAPDTARLRWLAAVTSATGPAFENSQPRGRAIPGARDSLRYTVAGRTVVLGVGSGVAYDYYASAPRSPRPDAGWADEEMRRLKRAAWDGSAWLLASHFGSPQHAIADTEIGDLVAAARGEGGTVRVAIARPTAALLRIEFARSAPAAAGGNVAGQ